MADKDISALLFLGMALAYGTWAWRKSNPMPHHRLLTIFCFLGFAFLFWVGKAETLFFGFVIGYGYATIRQRLKTERILGKELTEIAYKESA